MFTYICIILNYISNKQCCSIFMELVYKNNLGINGFNCNTIERLFSTHYKIFLFELNLKSIFF